MTAKQARGTPRSDAKVLHTNKQRGNDMEVVTLNIVPADFARSLERENAELREALEAALPRMSHKKECMTVRPSTEWAEHGSVCFDTCICEIRTARAALQNAKGAE